MAGISLRTLPPNLSVWLIATERCGIENALSVSIHDDAYTMASGSKIGDIQYLLLHVLWCPHMMTSEDSRSNSHHFVSNEKKSAAQLALEQIESFGTFTEWVKNNQGKSLATHEAMALGAFALVLQSHRYITGSANIETDDKVTFSPPFTRSQASRAQIDQSVRPQTPVTPTPSRPHQEDYSEPMNLDLDIETGSSPLSELGSTPILESSSILESSPIPESSPVYEANSPQTRETARLQDDEEPEMEVITSTILLIRAVTVFVKGVELMDCKTKQKKFTVLRRDGTTPLFTACTDGTLTKKGSGKTLVLIETKKKVRHTHPQAVDIRAQEACQMAAWIAQEPPENLEEMRKDGLSDKRFLISQDKNELWLSKGTYDAAYVDYISGRSINQSFLKMESIGPYYIEDYRDIKEICQIILALTYQELDN
ncbi:hypothetical protein F4810DRAFT_163852 [Camillea tinctor]|nr:hypothetical protein F4810DRAFT_163852 [Camillea tinctor]